MENLNEYSREFNRQFKPLTPREVIRKIYPNKVSFYYNLLGGIEVYHLDLIDAFKYFSIIQRLTFVPSMQGGYSFDNKDKFFQLFTLTQN